MAVPTRFLRQDAGSDLRMSKCGGRASRKDGGCQSLIRGWQGSQEEETVLGVRDTHRCVEQLDPGLIQLGKLRGERGGVVESGLYELNEYIEYSDASRSTAVSVPKDLPLVIKGGIVDIRGDDGIDVRLDVKPQISKGTPVYSGPLIDICPRRACGVSNDVICLI